MAYARPFDVPHPDIHMAENGEPTAVDEHKAVENLRETETSEMQAEIPQDQRLQWHVTQLRVFGCSIWK